MGEPRGSPTLVGVPRFELGTSPTRTERATRLRHTPSAQSVATSRAILGSCFAQCSSTSTSRSFGPGRSSGRRGTGAWASGTGSRSSRALRRGESGGDREAAGRARARARRRDLDRVHRAHRPRHGRRRGRRPGVRDRHGAGVGATRELLALRRRAPRARRASAAQPEDRARLERPARPRRVRRAPQPGGRRDGGLEVAREHQAASVDLRVRAARRWASRPRRRRWSATPTRTTSRALARSGCGRSCSTATACVRTSPSGSTRCSRSRRRSASSAVGRACLPPTARARHARRSVCSPRRQAVPGIGPMRTPSLPLLASRPDRRTRPRRRSGASQSASDRRREDLGELAREPVSGRRAY